MRSCNSACMNKSNFTTEKKSCSEHMTVFEIVVHRNVDTILLDTITDMIYLVNNIHLQKFACCISLQLPVLFFIKWIVSAFRHAS